MPLPKSTVPLIYPVMYELPEESTFISKPWSSEFPPAVYTHWKVDAELSFTTNMSSEPTPSEVISPVPKKLTVLENSPVKYAFPSESTSTPSPKSEPVPPSQWREVSVPS